MNLISLQRTLKAQLLHELPDPDTPYAAGLGVYRHAYRTRLHEFLRKTFEKTWTWIGDEAFEQALEIHVREHPPSRWTLDDYGSGLPGTLARIFPEAPEVADLAWLEAAIHRAFGAPDSPRFSLHEVDWDNNQFVPAASVQIRGVTTNCVEIWRAIATGSAPPEQLVRDSPVTLCVWREELAPRFRHLAQEEADFLARLASEASFADTCRALATNSPAAENALAVGTILARLIGEGVIGGFRATSAG